MSRRLTGYAVLAAVGAAWGLSAPMVRAAVGAGHHPLAILFWQSLFGVLALGAVLLRTGALRGLPLDARHLRLYAVVGLCGMALPLWASYTAARVLPAGVTSIIVALVPVFALPMALMLGTERPEARRIGGVVLGALAMGLLMAPGAAVPGAGAWLWVPVAALAPFFYAVEGAFVAGSGGMKAGPLAVLWAGYVACAAAAAVLVLASGAPLVAPVGWDVTALGFVVSGLLGIGAYAGYLWLLRAGGAVFGAQVAYAVTGMGMLWSVLLLGEAHSLWVWAALALLAVALALVQPRGRLAAS